MEINISSDRGSSISHKNSNTPKKPQKHLILEKREKLGNLEI